MPVTPHKGRSGGDPYKTRTSSYVSTTFSSNTTFTTPKADYMEITMDGAGGGGGKYVNFGNAGNGAAGGRLTFRMAIRNDKTLTLTIGSGGAKGGATNAKGGGLSKISLGDTTVAIAGGGGAGCGIHAEGGGHYAGHGGAGGGTTANAGTNGSYGSEMLGTGGAGGTQAADGEVGYGHAVVGDVYWSANGSGIAGGSVSDLTHVTRAGYGGYGYYNGGGGGCAIALESSSPDVYLGAGGGGGGGSSYVNTGISGVTITNVYHGIGEGAAHGLGASYPSISETDGTSGSITISYYEYNF